MKKRWVSSGGQAVVEFALVLPFMVLLLLGIIEFGIIYYNKAVVTNASREGARAGVEHIKDDEGNCPNVGREAVVDAVDDYLESKLISFGDITYTVNESPFVGLGPDCDPQAEGYVEVIVTYTHNFLSVPDTFGKTINIPARTRMRLQ